MSTAISQPARRPWMPLSVRISICLVCAAVIPLLAMFIFISTQTIHTLIDQSNKAMANDAQMRQQEIDDYFTQRLLDLQTVQNAANQVPSVTKILTVDQPGSATYKSDLTLSYYIVTSGYVRDTHYTNWSVFYKTGQLAFYYPLTTPPQPHGAALIPSDLLKQVNSGNTFISPVYYSPQTKKAYVDLYAPIYEVPQAVTVVGSSSQQPTSVTQNNTATPPQQATPTVQGNATSSSSQDNTAASAQQATTAQQGKIIGVLRATMNLDYIWDNIVKKEINNNGDRSYAFIVDNNGVRVADTTPSRLFTSIAPLSNSTQQTIANEKLYGTSNPVTLLADNPLEASMKKKTTADSFQEQPAGEQENYQVVRQALTIVPWYYVVLSPTSTVTSVATTQQINIAIIALIAAISVAVIGGLVGRGISRPILKAVEHLQANSQSLNDLATQQQDAATEQVWVVDASQVGLQSVQYYTQATKFASNHLQTATQHILQYWTQTDPQTVNNNLGQVRNIANYIENATAHQETSNQKLATALKVTTQVTEQLHEGAASANEAANQLEQIVSDLRSVVGE